MTPGIRVGGILVFLAAACVVHASLGDSLSIHGARPNLAVASLLAACLFVRGSTGAVLGLSVGLFEGSYAGVYVGSIAVTRTLAGWVVGSLEERVFRDNAVVAFVVVAVGSAAVEALFYLFAPAPFFGPWLQRTIGGVAYNAALAVPLYLVARRTARLRPAP